MASHLLFKGIHEPCQKARFHYLLRRSFLEEKFKGEFVFNRQRIISLKKEKVYQTFSFYAVKAKLFARGGQA